MDILSMRINDLVREDMRLSSFFKEEKIDFCCNGFKVLGSVLDEDKKDKAKFVANFDAFLAGLDKKGTKEDFFNDMDNEELINYIVSEHHRFTRNVLKELDGYVPAILRAHFSEDGELLLKINRLYGDLRTELLEHLIKEEKILFPMIIAGDFEGARVDIQSTESEHDAAGELLRSLREATGDYEIPSWACNTFRAAYHHLMALESDLFRHIFLENSVLFERIA